MTFNIFSKIFLNKWIDNGKKYTGQSSTPQITDSFEFIHLH